MDADGVMVIGDGEPGTLLALAREGATKRLALFLPAGLSNGRRDAISRQVAHFGIEDVVESSTVVRCDASLDYAIVLLLASREALARGCRRVVWPINVGGDVRAMTMIVDMCGLLTSMLERDASTAGRIDLDLPWIDCDAEALVACAIDLGVDPSLAWYCETSDATPCQQCAGCRRWSTLGRVAPSQGKSPDATLGLA